MGSRRSESDITRLRRCASESAHERKEKLSTVHLLAAVWQGGGPARTLLDERRLDGAALLKAARSFDEDANLLEQVLGEARDVARRAAVPSRGALPSTHRHGARPVAQPEPSGIHVLVVLLSSRRAAAYRALTHCGVDVSRLRTAATRVALGVVTPPRAARQQAQSTAGSPAQSQRRGAAPTGSVHPGLSPRSSTRDASEAAGRSGPGSTRPPPSRSRAVQVPLIPPLRPPFKTSPGVGVAEPVVERDEPTRSEPRRGAVRRSRQRDADDSKRAPAQRRSSQARQSPKGGSPPGAALALDPERHPSLAALTNLTLEAAEQRLEPIVGREPEIEQALDILAKRHGNSPLLVGRAGVGKTSLARGIACRFADEAGPDGPRLLLELPVSELIAGTSARGSLAERMATLRAEVRSCAGRVVLFVDEIHELLGSSALDEVATDLKAAMARGELPLVGATSPEEYRRAIEVDPGLARRFTVVEVDEPNEADSFLILRSASGSLSNHHRVDYSDEAIAVAVSWSIRYLPGRALPDKALGVLDLAGARLRRRSLSAEPGKSAKPRERNRVEPAHVAEVVAEIADVPIDRLMETDQERMLDADRLLGDRVIGHEDACARIAAVLRRNAAGLRGKRPIGTFLLLGPTGVGKTEMAKAIAEVLFHAPEAMTRLDMSEYAEAHAVARLIGAPPGYVGHEAGGLLTEAVRRRPYQVVLLDEIEKAHRDVLQSFLQVFDEGRMTDGRGRTVDLTNSVIVLTSNLGAGELRAALNERRVGFSQRSDSAGPDRARMSDVALKAARAALPPELYNRLDEVIFFRHLEREDLRSIARRLLAGLTARLAARDIRLQVSESAIDALLEQGGYDAELGARPLRRAIARHIEAPLADMILGGELEPGAVALVEGQDGEVVVDAVAGESAA